MHYIAVTDGHSLV